MAASKQAADGREEATKKDMVSIVREITDTLAHDSSQITEIHTNRNDMVGYEVAHPINHARVYAKRGVTSDGWGYVWKRIHVEIEHKAIGMNRIMDIKREKNLEVTDIWQTDQNVEDEMGQHKTPAFSFSLEPRK